MKQLTVLILSISELCIVSTIFSRPNLNFMIEDEYNYVPDKDFSLKYKHYLELDDPEQFDFQVDRDAEFILYTRANPTSGQSIHINDLSSVRNSTFDPTLPTRFLIHGWFSDRHSLFNSRIRDAYLAKGNFNVVVVDWGVGANTINYVSARNRVHPVGVFTASFIDKLVESVGLNTQTTYIIGYSLGAHAAGICGKYVQNRINTIYGLDPAGPLFYDKWDKDRLNVDDANYVEVIHTSAGSLGFSNPIGYSDFYPNGGSSQLGCGFDFFRICSHSRSYEYFAESLNSEKGFWAIPCYYSQLGNGRCTRDGNSGYMSGDPGNYGAHISNIYYLSTNNQYPFALGHD